MLKPRISFDLTLINGEGGDHHPPSENRVFSATEHRMNPGPVFKFEFYRCGSVEKNESALSLLG